MQADAQLQRKYKGILHCIIHSYKTEGAQVSRDLEPKTREQQKHNTIIKVLIANTAILLSGAVICS